jgi:ParB family chromosome partitioning protein
MALKQNKDGMAAAIAAAAQATGAGRAHPSLPKGTIGAVRAGVAGIQEISPQDILPWGPQDRLGAELTAVNSHETVEELAESIKTNGQQVPVLLRPSREQDGKFEVIYGRRRVLACRMAGVAVKALVRTMDDGQALIAKGLENSSREDLSFYERARFAKAITEQGYSNEELMQALSISKNTLSQLNRITKHIPDDIGDLIGAAPKSGRSRWELISDAFRDKTLIVKDVKELLEEYPQSWDSDMRMDAFLLFLKPGKPTAKPAEKRIARGVSLKSDDRGIIISVKNSGDAVFAKWLEENIEELVKKAHDEAG